MLRHLRARITGKLLETTSVTLATSGPAGIQLGLCPARSMGLIVYLLVPVTSEHLVNLEEAAKVALTADLWRLTGMARLDVTQHPFSELEADYHRIIEIRPERFEFLQQEGEQASETIDIEESDLRLPE